MVTKKSVMQSMEIDDESKLEDFLESEDEYLKDEFKVNLHYEAQSKNYKYMFLCFADTETWMDARGAQGSYSPIRVDALQITIGKQTERIQRLQAYLHDHGYQFLPAGFYMYAYEGS